MADERRDRGHNGEERRRGERRRGEERPPDEAGRDLPDPGMQSRRSELYEGFYDRDRHAERHGQWGWREQDRPDEFGAWHRAEGAPPERPWRAEDRPEYGGDQPRAPAPSRWELTQGRAYPRPEPPFEHRPRPGYQADRYESGLTMRHPEHVTRPALDDIPASDRGGYRGVGPRGYRRSDERIWEDVCEHLTHAASVDASDIEVRVEHGEVTLEGSVENRRQKRAAEDIAEHVAGVVDVHNRLRLSREGRRGARDERS